MNNVLNLFQQARVLQPTRTTPNSPAAAANGDSWYEQGWMEGKLNMVSWATEELKKTLWPFQGSPRPVPTEGVQLKGFQEAMSSFFIALAQANDIKADTQHISYELDWERVLESVAAEYVAINKS